VSADGAVLRFPSDVVDLDVHGPSEDVSDSSLGLDIVPIMLHQALRPRVEATTLFEGQSRAHVRHVILVHALEGEAEHGEGVVR
jgi:hypothetical protein